MSSASVSSGGEVRGSIGPGILVLAGFGPEDDAASVERMAGRIRKLRIFDDGSGRLVEGLGSRGILCISQFTLYADTSRGNRPGFSGAASPAKAEPLYAALCESLGAESGAFGAHMEIEMVADGPVTLIISD